MLLRLRVRLPFPRFSLRSYVKVAPATPPRLVALEVLLPHTPVCFVQGKLLMRHAAVEGPTATRRQTPSHSSRRVWWLWDQVGWASGL